EAYPDALNMILLKGDVVVGRHLVERHENTFRSIDLVVLPAHQNQGIGTLAIQQLQEKAALEDKTIHLSASKTNPALGLYQRLGFFPLYEDDVSVELEWLPPARMTKACL
ncbi:MAG: GNAT family N-acetyltransferase, partial [Janthinobacterium lividum]